MRAAVALALWAAVAVLVFFFVFSGWWLFFPFFFAGGGGEPVLRLILAIVGLSALAYLVGRRGTR